MKRYCPLTVAGAALCFTAFPALAQSTVSMYGLIDMSIGRTQAPGAAAVNGVDSGKMTTSFLGLRGTEDLGGGQKAHFVLDSFLRADTGSPGRFDGDAFFARNAYVGLENSFGTVILGRLTTTLFLQTLTHNAFGDSFGYSPSIRHYFTSGTTTGDTGWSDSIRYTSPRFNGFSLSLQTALGEGNGGNNSAVGAQYAADKLSAAFVWQGVKKGAATADTETWQLAGSYDFGLAKLFGQHGEVENKTTGNEYKLSSIGATAPLGPNGLLRAQWGRLNPEIGATRSTFSLGYSHFLSKRTELYAVAMSDKLRGTGTGSNYSLGMRHRF